MPREIFNEEKFLQLAEHSIHCRVKRIQDTVKLKIRTKKMLYTYKTDPDSAERILKSLSCEIIEL